VLLRKGPQELSVIRGEVERWMEEHEYESIEQMKGSLSQRSAADPALFERANYMKTLNSYKRV
jgi:dihydroorotate dehydrogenase (fumarate)